MSSKLYIQNRLYNVNDRLIALDLYERIEKWIQDGVLVDMESSFLPFKSSNNNSCGGEAGIFEMDRQALRECAGVAGYFDGWTYDPGCAFEIGCGYAWGYPIHLITTDIYQSSVGNSAEYYHASKLVEHISTMVAVSDLNQDISDYRERNTDVLNRAIEEFKQNLIIDFGEPRKASEKIAALPIEYDYYIDPNFKYYEPARMVLEQIIKAIEAADKTYIIGDNQGDIDKDLEHVRKSGQGIFYFDAAEPNVDTGVLQGFSYGSGRKPLVYASNEQRIMMSGKWAIQLNTMNYWCAQKVATTIEELVCTIKGE